MTTSANITSEALSSMIVGAELCDRREGGSGYEYVAVRRERYNVFTVWTRNVAPVGIGGGGSSWQDTGKSVRLVLEYVAGLDQR